LKYKSKLQDQAGSDDEAAKNQLSQFAYDKFFDIDYKATCRLQYLANENGTQVWPNGKPHIVMKTSPS
jgi:hypothetical protein